MKPSRDEAEAAVRTLLLWAGDKPRNGTKETPKRVVDAYKEWFKGYTLDPKSILSKQFESESEGPVVLNGILFESHCEHHLAAIVGTVDIAYIPAGNRVVGLSKLARLTECFSKRLQNQERMTYQIAEALFEHVATSAVVVRVKAEHHCMVTRGVHMRGQVMVTQEIRGSVKRNAAQRAELTALLDIR